MESLTEKYTGRAVPNDESLQAVENDYQACGSVLSGKQGHEVMLDLRFRTGDRKALSYSYLVSVEFDRSKGVTLEFTGHRVEIRGRNLEDVYQRLLFHRAGFIAESDVGISDEAAQEPVIQDIKVGVQ